MQKFQLKQQSLLGSILTSSILSSGVLGASFIGGFSSIAFSEWDAKWGAQWFSQLGLHSSSSKMDAGRVQGYNNDSSMMGYGDPTNPTTIPSAFNAAEHSKTDGGFKVEVQKEQHDAA